MKGKVKGKVKGEGETMVTSDLWIPDLDGAFLCRAVAHTSGRRYFNGVQFSNLQIVNVYLVVGSWHVHLVVVESHDAVLDLVADDLSIGVLAGNRLPNHSNRLQRQASSSRLWLKRAADIGRIGWHSMNAYGGIV